MGKDSWVPENWDSPVLIRFRGQSAIESNAIPVPMGFDSKRLGSLTLDARKFGQAMRVSPEDLADPEIDIVNQMKLDWAVQAAKYFDNACIGVSGDESGILRPYGSINHLADNHFKFRFDSKEDFKTVLGPYQNSDNSDHVVMVHPAFRSKMKTLGLLEHNASTGSDLLMGVRIHWTLGARVSEEATANPEGNPLLVVADVFDMFNGVRSGPETRFVASRYAATSFLDEDGERPEPELDMIQIRARRAFSIRNPQNFRVAELKS